MYLRAVFVEYENINADLDASGIQGGADLNSVNGEIRVADLRGRIRISTVNGKIHSQGLNGNINLNTVNGRIEDRGSSGEDIVYESVNGDIRADTQVPRVKLETVNADSELKMARTEQLRASNVNGDTSVRLELAEGGEVKASSVSGSLQLQFQQGVSARSILKVMLVVTCVINLLTTSQGKPSTARLAGLISAPKKAAAGLRFLPSVVQWCSAAIEQKIASGYQAG